IWPLRRWSWAREYLTGVPAATPAQQAAPLKLSALLLEKAPLVLLAIASTSLTVISHEGLGITQQSHGLPFELRMENAFVSYARYLGKFLWPSHLAVLYAHPGKWAEGVVWVRLFLLVILSFLSAL